MKVKNSNCDVTQISNWDENQKLKLGCNLTTPTVMKLKNSNCDETQKLK